MNDFPQLSEFEAFNKEELSYGMNLTWYEFIWYESYTT